MKHITSFIGTSTVALLILASPALFGQNSAAAGKKAQGSSDAKATGAAVAGKTADVAGKPADQDVIRAQKPAYPLKTCIVSNEELGKDGPPIEYVVNGRLVRLCCNDCKKDVDKDTAGTLKKLDLAVVSAQKSTYPLTTCPVTGEKLGDGAIDHVYGTRLVRLANKDAVAAFEKDPKPVMAKVDKALIDAQRPGYKMKTCVVSKEELGGDMGEPVDYLYGTKLVRFCCKSCVKQFEKDPDPFLKELASAK